MKNIIRGTEDWSEGYTHFNEVSEWGKKTGHKWKKTITEITEGRL